MAPDAFVLDGFSKRYAMTGFRLGWVVAPEAAMRRLQILQQSSLPDTGISRQDHYFHWFSETLMGSPSERFVTTDNSRGNQSNSAGQPVKCFTSHPTTPAVDKNLLSLIELT